MADFNFQDFMNWLGPAFGAYAGAKGSGGQTQTATQSPYFQPYQNEIAQEAQGLWSQGMPNYTGQTWAGPTQDTYAGWDQIANWAQGTPYAQNLGNQANWLTSGQAFGQGSPFNASTNKAQSTSLGPQQLAGQSVANTAIPNSEYLGMAKDATAQFGGASAGNAALAGNPYIGQTSQGVGSAPSAMGLLGNAPQAVTGNAASAGPASQASASSNPYFGFDNPYTDRAIADATRDMTRNFSQNTMPQIDRLMQQSGSFGNTGVQQMQQNAMSDFNRDVGDVANRMRMGDLQAQQQMGENAANRGTGVSQFNAGAQNQMGQFNAGLGQQMNLANMGAMNDMSRFGYGTNANLAMFDVGNQVGNQRFNATLGSNDLSRNAQLQQGLGTYNAGSMNNMNQFNAGLAQQAGMSNANNINNMLQYGLGAYNQGQQFNAGQGNALGMYNAGQGNQMNMYGVGQNNAMNQFNAGQGNAMNQFNAGQNWNAYNTGLGLNQYMDSLALNQGNAMVGIGNQQQGQAQAGLNNNYQQWQQQAMAPYNNMNWYSGMINPLNGGQTNSQYYPGNPWLGGLSGGLTFGSMMPYLFGG